MTSKLASLYSYTAINRETVNGSRLYATPDGAKVPSVTTILDKTKPQEARQKLQEWRKRVGTENAQRITTEAAARGTRMHTFLEHYVKEGITKPQPENPFAVHSWSMANTVIQQGLQQVQEFWGIEVPVYFPNVYAGTTDCVGIHNKLPSILDFKQTNKPKREEWITDYFLQLCAYAEAHNEIHNTQIKKGVILMCTQPKVSPSGLILEQPQYQEFILDGEKFEKHRAMWWRRVEEYYTKYT